MLEWKCDVLSKKLSKIYEGIFGFIGSTIFGIPGQSLSHATGNAKFITKKFKLINISVVIKLEFDEPELLQDSAKFSNFKIGMINKTLIAFMEDSNIFIESSFRIYTSIIFLAADLDYRTI